MTQKSNKPLAVMEITESRPENYGPLRDANGHAVITGPCGDTVEIWLRIDGGRIRQINFSTTGCGWSQHCCATAAELGRFRTPEAVRRLTQDHVLLAAGQIPVDHRHCALLALNTLIAALEDFEKSPAPQRLARRIWTFIKGPTTL